MTEPYEKNVMLSNVKLLVQFLQLIFFLYALLLNRLYKFLFLQQFDAEFRRWSCKRHEHNSFEEFQCLIEKLHKLERSQLLISYIDPRDNDLLPINNDDNFGRALSIARPLLRVIVQRKGKPC
jgi:partitioning defective protein 6